MVSKFGKSGSGFSNKGEREKFLFIAAAGTALAVVVIFILVAGFKTGAPPPPQAAAPVEDPVAALNRDNVSLIVPETEVVPGTPLSEVKFKKAFWPRLTAPEGVFTDATQVASLYAKTKLAPGLPVQRKDTTTSDQSRNIDSMGLTPGNRAVTIDVDDTSGVEGHATPGTHVDVVLTYTQAGNLVSNIIVQNARVLSYGGDSTTGSGLRERRVSRVARTMTLDVAVQDALKIQTARQMGRLSLIMRAAEDDAAASSTNFTASDIAQANKKDKPVPQAAVCSKGRIKMAGKEYIVGCDGSMSPVQ